MITLSRKELITSSVCIFGVIIFAVWSLISMENKNIDLRIEIARCEAKLEVKAVTTIKTLTEDSGQIENNFFHTLYQ